MKLIIAIVRPFTVEKIVTAFENIEGFPGMTLIDSEGFGQRMGTGTYDSLDPFKANKRIEIAVSDEMADEIVAAIKHNAHTGKKGDGIITVVPIEAATLI
ncbi:MAG: P-II family nitrogen regulator [Pyrinomonadaceae bacterium]|jgi:nitrogen regulatory protein P-II 2|nr:P-II family nitrogen regulator [Pyrinomonadaceae bacterium]